MGKGYNFMIFPYDILNDYQDLTIWCSNNWRIQRGLARKSNNWRPNRTDVLWHIRKNDVMAEIEEITGLNAETMESSDRFTNRTKAAKNIIERMNAQELDDFEKQVQEYSNKGHNKEHQRM